MRRLMILGVDVVAAEVMDMVKEIMGETTIFSNKENQITTRSWRKMMRMLRNIKGGKRIVKIFVIDAV